MKIAIFGGSFDPPHKGHMAIVQKALAMLDIDYLFVVPTYRNPLKASFNAPPKLRLKWLKKIFLAQKRVIVSDYEIKRGKPTYTLQTLQYLRKKYTPQKIYLIIGSDNLKTFHLWYRYKKLQKLAEFIVATRRGYNVPKKYKKIFIDIPISSTSLRKNPQRRYLYPLIADEIIHFYRSLTPAKTPQSDTFADTPLS